MQSREVVGMLKLYENIKKRRLELHLTQEQLALKMGYSDKGMISKIEKGLIDIPQSKIVEFAKVLRTEPSALMGWTEPQVDYHVKIDGREDILLEVEKMDADKYNQLLAFAKFINQGKEDDGNVDRQQQIIREVPR